MVIPTCDPAALDRLWLAEHAPEVIAIESRRYPAPSTVATILGGSVEPSVVPIPLNRTNGFGEAHHGRPEALLDPGARRANLARSFVGKELGTGWNAGCGQIWIPVPGGAGHGSCGPWAPSAARSG